MPASRIWSTFCLRSCSVTSLLGTLQAHQLHAVLVVIESGGCGEAEIDLRAAEVGRGLDLHAHRLPVYRVNLAWAAAYNAVGVPLTVAGLMPAWAAGLGMAASSLLVALNALRLSRD